MEWIKGIVKQPGERYGHEEMIKNDLGALQKKVGGYIETVTIAEDLVIVCNEEGRLEGLPRNCNICGVDFVGTIMFLGVKGEEFTDVPMTIDEYKSLFAKSFV